MRLYQEMRVLRCGRSIVADLLFLLLAKPCLVVDNLLHMLVEKHIKVVEDKDLTIHSNLNMSQEQKVISKSQYVVSLGFICRFRLASESNPSFKPNSSDHVTNGQWTNNIYKELYPII